MGWFWWLGFFVIAVTRRPWRSDFNFNNFEFNDFHGTSPNKKERHHPEGMSTPRVEKFFVISRESPHPERIWKFAFCHGRDVVKPLRGLFGACAMRTSHYPQAAPKRTWPANGRLDTFYAGSRGGCLKQLTQKRKSEVLQTPKPEPSITFGRGWALRPLVSVRIKQTDKLNAALLGSPATISHRGITHYG